jgi:hypothetical protein
MNIDLTQDEAITILDALRGRLDDLNDCAMFGDANEIEGEIETVDELFTKLAETLEAARA